MPNYDYAIVKVSRNEGLEDLLNEKGALGYRVVATEITSGDKVIVIMEKETN